MANEVYSMSGQLISPLDPNYETYKAQNNPVPGAAPAAPAAATPTLTPAPAPAQTNNPSLATNNGPFDLSSVFKDIQSPMTIADIRKAEEDARIRRQQEADFRFNPQIDQAKAIGADKYGSGQGQLGVARGLGLSSAELSYLGSIQKETDDQVRKIQAAKDEFIASGNAEAAQRADKAISDLLQYNVNITLKKAELMLSNYTAGQKDRELAQNAINDTIANQVNLANLDINTIKALTDVTSDKTVTINGQEYKGLKQADPVFDGAQIVQLMKSLPLGKTEVINDPRTGLPLMTIQGIASSDPNLKQFTATDDKGNLSIINFDPASGKTTSVTKVVGVGKTKTQPASTTINLPSYSNVPYYVNGKQSGVVRFDSKSNKNVIVSNNGQTLEQLPDGATLGSFSGGNPSTDPYQQLLDESSQ